jgi:hypothetical protein
VVACVPRISENHLVPALRAMLDQFPFPVRGFHSDGWPAPDHAADIDAFCRDWLNPT